MTGKQRIREELNELVLNVELVRGNVERGFIKPAEGYKHNQTLVDQALDSIEEVLKDVLNIGDKPMPKVPAKNGEPIEVTYYQHAVSSTLAEQLRRWSGND